MNDAEELLRAALPKAPPALAEHVVRVVLEAQRLAEIHHVSRQNATIAALGHDLLRAHSDERLLNIAREQGYQFHDVDQMAPILMHGPLAIPILREQYAVIDAEVLGAISYHTTGHPGMTPLQQVLFLADKIEPEKRARAAAIDRVAELATTDLDAAMLVYLNHHVEVALETGWPLHPHSVAARNELLAKRRAATPAD